MGKDLFGKAATLTLSGNLTLEDQPLRLSGGALDLLHTDGGNGFVKASWDFVPDLNRNKIDVALSEPRGGIGHAIDGYGGGFSSHSIDVGR